jgi:hypothetical protein
MKEESRSEEPTPCCFEGKSSQKKESIWEKPEAGDSFLENPSVSATKCVEDAARL